MRRNKQKLTGLWHALDEVAFGAERTLNLRESLPSVADARARAEAWLRARQVTKPEDVLIITGRGNNSAGGVGMIRQAISALLPSLKRRGIVATWKEHSPGSIVVTLAPMSSLFAAGARRRDTATVTTPHNDVSFAGLEPETLARLRELAISNLDSLSVEHAEPFLRKEMIRIFSAIAGALPEAGRDEAALRAAIQRAIEETYDDGRKKL